MDDQEQIQKLLTSLNSQNISSQQVRSLLSSITSSSPQFFSPSQKTHFSLPLLPPHLLLLCSVPLRPRTQLLRRPHPHSSSRFPHPPLVSIDPQVLILRKYAAFTRLLADLPTALANHRRFKEVTEQLQALSSAKPEGKMVHFVGPYEDALAVEPLAKAVAKSGAWAWDFCVKAALFLEVARDKAFKWNQAGLSEVGVIRSERMQKELGEHEVVRREVEWWNRKRGKFKEEEGEELVFGDVEF